MLETPEVPEDVMQVISFRLGSENFALDILDVQEIIRDQHMTRVPGSSSVDGVIHLRGKILPVITLRERFGFAAVPAGAQRIVVVQKGAAVAGFLVDSVPEVVRLASRDVRPLQRLETGSGDVVSGAVKAGDRLLMLLDTTRLLRAGECANAPVPASSD
jgi:purine-binding chemotaxis protein CheW